MPIYEYRCNKCDHKFEMFQSIGASNESLSCPVCSEPKPDRLFSVFGSTGSSDSAYSAGGGCSSSSPFS